MSTYTTVSEDPTLTGGVARQVIVYRYSLPNVGGSGWALVTIGSDGSFAAVSDWGNFAFWWQAMGCDCRAFIAGAADDQGYFVLKLANPDAGAKGEKRAAAFVKRVLVRLAPILRQELADEARGLGVGL